MKINKILFLVWAIVFISSSLIATDFEKAVFKFRTAVEDGDIEKTVHNVETMFYVYAPLGLRKAILDEIRYVLNMPNLNFIFKVQLPYYLRFSDGKFRLSESNVAEIPSPGPFVGKDEFPK